MASRRLVKPVYKRQQFLLSFFKELNEPLIATDFQKLLFLYLTKNNLSYYDFVTYLYGSFSIQAGEDINTLQAMGWLTDTNGKIQYTGRDGLAGISLPFEGIGKSIPAKLPKVRGNRLVKLVYEQYPYYKQSYSGVHYGSRRYCQIKSEKNSLNKPNLCFLLLDMKE